MVYRFYTFLYLPTGTRAHSGPSKVYLDIYAAVLHLTISDAYRNDCEPKQSRRSVLSHPYIVISTDFGCQIMHEQVKVLKKKKFRQLPADKKRKLLRFSRLEILYGRQSQCETG